VCKTDRPRLRVGLTANSANLTRQSRSVNTYPLAVVSGDYDMAQYKDGGYLSKSDSTAFDVDHNPGTVPPNSGVYRCMGCGREIVAEKERTFPPQNHHQHTTAQGAIRWRLIVFADHSAK